MAEFLALEHGAAEATSSASETGGASRVLDGERFIAQLVGGLFGASDSFDRLSRYSSDVAVPCRYSDPEVRSMARFDPTTSGTSGSRVATAALLSMASCTRCGR